MRWKIDKCPDANGGYTLREDDGTEHGDTETCIATVYGGLLEQELIESAPRLKEECDRLKKLVRIMTLALRRADEGNASALGYFDKEDSPGVVRDVARADRAVVAALKVVDGEAIEETPAEKLQEHVRIMQDALAVVAAFALEDDEGEEAEEEYARRDGGDAEEFLCICIKEARAALEATKPEGA